MDALKEKCKLLSVGCYDWSPSGDKIAVGFLKGGVRIYKYCEEVTTLVGETSSPDALKWSPDGQTLIFGNRKAIDNSSSEADNTIYLWDIDTGQAKTLLFRAEDAALWTSEWHPNATMVAGGLTNTSVITWEKNSGQIQNTFLAHSLVPYSIRWSYDGNYIVSTGYDGLMFVWSITTNMLVKEFKGFTDSLKSGAAWSPLQNRLLISDQSGMIFCWDLLSDRIIYFLQSQTSPLKEVKWSPNGKLIAGIAVDGSTCIWDATDGHLFHAQPPLQGRGWYVVWSPDSRFTVYSDLGGNVSVIDTDTFSQSILLNLSPDAVRSMLWSPGGGELVGLSQYHNTLWIWSIVA